jgi:hypothetical protein
MTQKRLPPEDRREHFETKVRQHSNGCHHWYFKSLPTTTFSWTEAVTPGGRRTNFALNIRKTAWHYAGKALLPGHAIVTNCGDPRCINADHLSQVTFSDVRWRMPPEVRSLGGRKYYQHFTDLELRDIWLDADNLLGAGLARRYQCCVSIIWNIQRGKRNRADIIRLFGPQIHWGQTRIRKYLNAKKNSTRNSTTTAGSGSLS